MSEHLNQYARMQKAYYDDTPLAVEDIEDTRFTHMAFFHLREPRK